MNTSSVAYDTALSPDRIKSLAASLQQLPDAKTYITHVTKGLQSTLFTAEQIEAERTWVDYEDVPPETQDLIGYTDDGELPWWLSEFRWGFALSTAEHVTPDNLEAIEQSDPSETEIKLPELGDTDVVKLLNALNNIAEVFEENLDLSDASPLDDPGIPELPDPVFEVNTTLVVTGEFERYFQSLIQFCPPLEPTLQALNTALAGLEHDYWELLPANARRGLEMLDINRSRNRKFFSNVRDLYRTSGEFGVSIDTEESADALGALEKLRYRSWRNSVSGDAPSEELFADAFKKGSNSSSSIDSLSKSLLVSPIYLNNGGYPTLETVTRESTSMHYDSSQAIHISAIADVLDFNQVKFDEW